MKKVEKLKVKKEAELLPKLKMTQVCGIFLIMRIYFFQITFKIKLYLLFETLFR